VADRHVDFLLIGGGVAAASCARELRASGASGSVLVVGREKDAPYERPPLSKSYLAGSSSRDDASFLPSGWYEENDVELLTRVSAMKMDADARVVKLSSKEEVSFGSALIATGAMVNRLRVEGAADLDGIHYLRAFGNSDAIREEALAAGSVVLVGGSYIGCELAATLTGLGVSCTILMQEDVVLERVLGAEVGGWVQRQLEERGVTVHGGDSLARFEGGSGDDARVTRVISEGGLSLDCGCVAIGAGVTPDVMLARAAGLELGERGGVACSSRLETSVPGIYAAGDVAEWDSPLHGGPALVEHFEVAVEHGSVAARNMLGGDEEFDTIPYFWSDLGDWATIEYVGVGLGDAVIRGSVDDGNFTAFYVSDVGPGGGAAGRPGGSGAASPGSPVARVVGAATVGRGDDLDHARRLIRAHATPTRAALADEATDLSTL
jgi:3-phenylpropionate/trans-cinnamate dioxygenase ferredoxin reductase subunit